MEITVNSGSLDLATGFSMEIEEYNPVFNELGSQSLPATVPASGNNRSLLGYPDHPETDMAPSGGKLQCRVTDGVLSKSGLLNMVSGSRREGLSFNIGFDSSTVFEKWQARKLSELEDLPVIVPGPWDGDIYDIILGYYLDGSPRLSPAAVFPIVVDNKNNEVDGQTQYYYEILNNLPDENFRQQRVISRLINSEPTAVTVPAYYGLTAFPWLYEVVEWVFADAGYKIEANPFLADPELARIVILNNCVDACCRGILDFADLMPDVTVAEFLTALLTRFGLVYTLDFERRTATLRFLRDIVKEMEHFDLTDKAVDWPLVNFETPKYVTLSAASSIEGAAPLTERFEDFIKGYDLDRMIFGRAIADWGWNEDRSDFDYDYPEYDDDVDWDPDEGREEWDFDLWDDWGDNWDDGFDDRDDYDFYSLKAATPQSVAAGDSSGNRIAFEVRTQLWFKLDKENKVVDEASTSFFNWDPQSEGLEPESYSSVDEWVPLQYVTIQERPHLHIKGFGDYVPMFLTGAKYCHTYVSQGDTDDDEKDGSSTPLAFLFAFNNCDEVPQGTVGRFSPETAQGKNIVFNDGSTHTLSLCFQFKNGLFARFWKDYDELLRHGAKSVEVPIRMSKADISSIEMLSPVRYGNDRYLIDKYSYSLPSPGVVAVDFSLRPLFTSGSYNLAAEQNIPDFEPGTRTSRWCYQSNNIRAVCQSDESRARAIALFRERNPQWRDPEGGNPVISCTTRFMKAVESGLVWYSDPANTGEAVVGKVRSCVYQAIAYYDIYRIRQRAVPSDQGIAFEDYVEDKPFDSVTIQVSYTVELIGKWVQN